MTDLRQAAQQALEALRGYRRELGDRQPCDAEQALDAALAQPTLQTCNCRWDGEVQVQQCTLHEAHVDAIHEWAGRAKVAEKKLAALAQPAHEPVAWTLTKTLTKRETTTNGYLWFSDPVNSSWTPLYVAPPQRKPLSGIEVERLLEQVIGSLPVARKLVRAVELAHGIGAKP